MKILFVFLHLHNHYIAYRPQGQPIIFVFASIRRFLRSRVEFSHSTHSRIIDIPNSTEYNIGMEDRDTLAEIIGENITRLRKMANMTQLELAESLNYSDKSVSKWEQGNGIPDVRILLQMSELFGVTLDDLVKKHDKQVVMPRKTKRIQRFITVICSTGLCWLVAVCIYVLLMLIDSQLPYSWLPFIYAVPASAIVVLVFSCVWHWKWVRIIAVSVIIWTVIACIFLTALAAGITSHEVWYLFLIGIPLQVLALFYFVWRKGAHFHD